MGIEDITRFYGKSYPLTLYLKLFRYGMNKSLNKALRDNEIVKQEGSVINSDGIEL